jgi:TonB family protein
VRLTLGFLIVSQAFAQSAPDAAALLARSASELQRYHSYQFTQDTTTGADASVPPVTMSTVTQAVNPGKVRTEMKMMGVDAMLMVSDGKDMWMYSPLLKQYSKLSGNGTDAALQDLASDGLPGTPGVADTKDLEANAKIVRSEVLELDGQPHDCWVIESRTNKVAPPGQRGANLKDAVFTFWIDKALGIQLKLSISGKTQAGPAGSPTTSRTTTTTRSLKLNEDLPDSLFVFTPPAGATETKELFSGTGDISPGAADTTPASTVQPAPKAPAFGEPEAFVPTLIPIDVVEPVYPPEARGQGLQGMIQLLVTIDATGAVTNAEVMSGRAELRPAALDAVKQYRFRPVIRNGHPVSAYTQTSVLFHLETKEPIKPEDLGLDLNEEMKSGQRIQELMARFPRSPEQILADSEEQSGGANAEERFYALTGLVRQAMDAGLLEKASSYATELLGMANDYKNDWNYGNAIYAGNSVLGLVALRQGNVAQARQYLLDSVKMSGSPQLDSFGPDFELARELAKKGERDAVLEFLNLCKGFWKLDGGRLDAMAAAVKNGETF